MKVSIGKSIALGVTVTLLSTSGTAMPAELMMLSIRGTNQGQLRGEVTLRPHEQKITALSYNHEVTQPIDVTDLQPSANRQYDFVKVRKVLGEATPQIFRAFLNQEVLQEVRIEMLRPDRTSGQRISFSVKLTNAKIVKIRHEETTPPSSTGAVGVSSSAGTTSRGGGTAVEEVWFVFQTIEITSPTAGTNHTASDSPVTPSPQ